MRRTSLRGFGQKALKMSRSPEYALMVSGGDEKQRLELQREYNQRLTDLQQQQMQQQQQGPPVPARRLPLGYQTDEGQFLLDYWTDEDGTCYQCDPNVSDCANSWDGWWRCDR